MNNILTQIKIDLYSSTSYEVIKAQQGDKNSRIIEFILYNQGEPYEFPDNIFFRFVGHRGDGSSFSKTEEECIMRNGNHVRVTLPEDVLYYDGTVEAKLVMYEPGDSKSKPVKPEPDGKLPEKTERTILSTIPFKISCIKNPCNENNLSEGELSIVTDLIFQMEEFSKNAQDVIDSAQEYATLAQSYAIGGTGKRDNEENDNARNYCKDAEKSKLDAAESAATATQKSDDASGYAKQAQSYALGTGGSRPGEDKDNAKHYYEQAKSYAVGGTGIRDNETEDNAKNYCKNAHEYYKQTKNISESFSGALRPMGTVTFANLPALANASEGGMYNISDQFTTNANFKEGTGKVIPAGANVYKTADGKWDVLAGSPVTGVRGAAEKNFHTGNVELTPENIGLGNVGNFKAVSTMASQGLSETEKTNARTNIGAAPTSHASTATTYGASSATYYGHAIASSTTPKANGTATVGAETEKFARGDHVHPLQTSVATATKATQDGDGNIIKDSYAVRRQIDHGDFNNISTPGIYGVSVSSNAPTSSDAYWNLVVLGKLKVNSYENVCQIASPIPIGASDPGSRTNLFARVSYASRWGAWKKLITEDDLLNKTYPIGSIYMSVNSTSPATLFGGTWARWGNGRIPVGVDTSQTEFNTVGKTGGEKTHILTEAEMPTHTHSTIATIVTTTSNGAHSHTAKYSNSANVNGNGARVNGSGTLEGYVINSNGDHTHNVTIPALTTDAKGNGTAHNNLPPYITCYMWKRTA